MEIKILSNQFLDYSVIALQEVDEAIKNCTGSNQKKLLVVYNSNKTKAESIEFLKKILSAAKFDIKDDILLLGTTSKQGFSFISMRTKVAFDNILVFGFPPTYLGLNIDINSYQPIHFNDCGFLFADDLSLLESNKQLKGELWMGMKELFKI